MNAVWIVFREHFKNFYLIQRLAQFQVKITNTNNYLGMAWELINPAMQIMVYWFVFGLGIRSNNPIDGVPFIYWLLVGISMWFFVNQGILEGTKSIATKYNHVAKMNFPLSIIPSYIVMSRFYGHLALLVVVIFICMLAGYYPTIYTLQLFLYVPFALILTTAIALFTSTLGVLVKDTQQAIQALMRMVFFASSILIVPPEGIVKDVMKLNPIYYLAEAYRSAVLHKEWYFITHWELTLYNMFIIILLFILGSILHMRYRDHFADFM
ncbi:teichoic acid ABC transporter permease [Staphylococcus saprophyticus]|jgi:teichoic acid transport system permease protein|uniref:Transport permease protein n=1 Tax=Staphylococcus saprophyticus TaxID=29385 RepID=A0A380HQJ3_STASA|nr:MULTISPECIES: ABC transporter permease [Staphylococcus]CRV25339.1 ABC transporter [Streptococcus equi subsp. equi]SIN56977.1 ABC-2 type transporter [Mycobacteroides abscessus subsp. abscessus]AMG18808.1 ABC transporter permease [Staphylococcus saprophyticus]AMG34198.1 ABC transporter permease [Staphylococcus saprophyticus]ASE57830.1 ABC transporter permease [Staphylococcus saprophyticus]